MKNKRNKSNGINASSMADIAFLLLVFFLVSTQINSDAGIRITLPAWVEIPQAPPPIHDRNLLVVQLNSLDQLLVEKEEAKISQLDKLVYNFLTQTADSLTVAVVSFKGDRGTSYEKYIGVYDQLKSGYRRLRDEIATDKFGLLFSECDQDQKRIIRMIAPMKISESEPDDFGQ
ncbi:MAG: biopolymer transport protein ExbD [Limisphaerales bacterium]|jgi:biopolymer transport protein ExbD